MPVGNSARRDADAVGRVAQDRTLGAGDVDGQPHAAVGHMLDRSDASGKLRRDLAAEHFCSGAPGFEPWRADAPEHAAAAPRRAPGAAPGASAARTRRRKTERRRRASGRKPGSWRKREIGDRAERQKHRDQDEAGAAIDLGRDGCGDGARDGMRRRQSSAALVRAGSPGATAVRRSRQPAGSLSGISAGRASGRRQAAGAAQARLRARPSERTWRVRRRCPAIVSLRHPVLPPRLPLARQATYAT